MLDNYKQPLPVHDESTPQQSPTPALQHLALDQGNC